MSGEPMSLDDSRPVTQQEWKKFLDDEEERLHEEFDALERELKLTLADIEAHVKRVLSKARKEMVKNVEDLRKELEPEEE